MDFLKEKGGKVKNTDLIEQFKTVFPEEPEKKTAVRNRFKNYVDNVAFVKTECGVKYVCLKKKFRGSFKCKPSVGNETSGTERQVLNEKRAPASDCGQVSGDDAAQPRAAGGETPGSGYGNDSQVKVPPVVSPETILLDETDDESRPECHEFVCVVEEVDSSSGEMGNRGSIRRERRESKKEQVGKAPDIPEIAVIEASPLPAEGSQFTLPGPAQTGVAGNVDILNPRDRQAEAGPVSREGLKEAEQIHVVTRRQSSKGSQHGTRHLQPEEGDDEGLLDTHSLSGSEGSSSPRGSRKHFIEVMMNSSPQVRRSMVLRNSVCLSFRSDSDSVSLVSSNPDDDRASVTLDPLEHEWMMCASDGEWASLYRLLTTEPSLILRKDFVSGFTCLHWAAKHGKPELLALIINFAKQHNVAISVDVRSNTGYTPLHIAAMHNHMEVVKLLVGAYNADVEIRDYSGRKACQYLTDNVSVDMRDIIGAYEHSGSDSTDHKDRGRWRFSKVLQSNLKPLRLLSPSDCDSVDRDYLPREKPVRRKSSFSRMKPKLERLRMRTSQIVHGTTFHDTEELERSVRGSFKSRPKTHFFG